ncbi:hypothetical protein ABT063_50765 [Streptomyces sp. NPDC002838]|uniref:hypothetical protein n=1 Tax=Streptomyces sp. NPDC002838 TaxID=3154436 RepID=UPI003333D9C3
MSEESGPVTLWQESYLSDPASGTGASRTGRAFYSTSGPVEIDLLCAAYDRVVAGHPALRSAHHHGPEGWWQAADPHPAPARAEPLANGGVVIGPAEFGDGVGRTLRIEVVPTRSGIDLTFCLDFLFLDGTALERVLDELLDAYDRLLRGEDLGAPEESTAPWSIAAWQRARAEASGDEVFKYWEQELGAEQVRPFFTPPNSPGEACSVVRPLPGLDREQLGVIARHRHVSLFVLVLNSVARSLSPEDAGRIAVRSPFRGRMFSPDPNAVTTTANTLPVVCDVGGDWAQSAATLGERVLRTMRMEFMPARTVEAMLKERGALALQLRAMPFVAVTDGRGLRLGSHGLEPRASTEAGVGHAPLSVHLDIFDDRSELRCYYDLSAIGPQAMGGFLDAVSAELTGHA